MGRSCPVIVAMKGHPGTGKSTLARAIASAIRCPLLDKDDIRDCTATLEKDRHLPPALLNDLSYSVLWQMARTQLQLGLDVVIDSPLSRRACLDSLINLGGGPRKARLIIVECRASDEEEWRRRLEQRAAAASDGAVGWHKPGTWQELQRLVEGYRGCNDYELGNVPKVVVDTTGADGIEELVRRVLEFVSSEVGEQQPPAAWTRALAGMSDDLSGSFHFGNDLSEARVM